MVALRRLFAFCHRSRFSPWVLPWALVACVLVSGFFVRPSCDTRGIDLEMRLNEARCVLDGYDPFLVWNGTTPRPGYEPWGFEHLLEVEKYKLVHAYPPWAYTFVMPLAVLPREWARLIYVAGEYAVLVALFCSAFWLGLQRGRHGLVSGFIALDAVLVAVPAMARCLVDHNFGIFITGAAAMAMFCHHRGRHAIAGVFWALTLVKPQIGLLFFLPLVVRNKWRTIVVSAVVVLTATLIPAGLCHRSPVEMVLAVSQCSRGQFNGTGLIPCRLFANLLPCYGETPLMLTSAGVGCVFCLLCTWLVRKEKDIFEWVIPPVVCALAWATSRLHDHSVAALAFVGLALACDRAQKISEALLSAALLVFFIFHDLDGAFALFFNPFLVVALFILFCRSVHDFRRERGGRLC